MNDAYLLVGKEDTPLDSDDGGTLESSRYTPIQVLLSCDMQLADDARLEEQCNLHRDGERITVDGKWWSIVDIVGARRLAFEPIGYVLPRLELHQSRAVVLPQLAQSRAHMPDDFGIVVILPLIQTGRAATEQLLLGLQLLMDLQAAAKP